MVGGNVTNAGGITVDGDGFTSEGGSSVTIGGTLSNTGGLTIGVTTGGLAAPTRVTAAALVNTGQIKLTGNYNGTPANTATLDIGSAAGFGTLGVLTGNVYLNGAAALEFASGQIGTIASGAQLTLYGASLLTDASNTTHNSALAGLTTIAGGFDFAYGETLAISNSVSILSGGNWSIDGDGYTSEGGSSVTIAGTLSNAGGLTIGVTTGGLTAPTRVTAAALVNTGQIRLTGNTGGTPANSVTLDIGSAAGFGTLGVLTGSVSLDGAAALEFASGQIGTIGSGAGLTLFGASLLTDASNTTHNSALAGLTTIAGGFDFAYGETLAISNSVAILSGGSWSIDGDGYTSEGGSSVTLGGTLSNAGNLTIGVTTGGLTAPTRVVAAALANTGQITLTGNDKGTPANTATLDIGGAAGFGTLGVLTGNVSLNGAAALEFGSGQIGTIASGAELTLYGASLVTDASDTTHNSALAGLTTIAGGFDFAYGETLAIGNSVSILSGGGWSIDGDGYTSEGGSSVTIAGTLSNAGNLTIGVTTGGLTAPTRVTAAALVNTGQIKLTGNYNGTPANTATLDVGSAAGFGVLGVLTSSVYLNGASVLEFASGQIGTIASGAGLTLYGASLLADASDTTHNSALSGLTTIAGGFDFAYGETLAISDSVSILSGGGWSIDGDGYTSEGGSSVTIAGTLNNAGSLAIGVTTGGLTAPTRVTAAALVNTNQIQLTGNYNGTPANTATLAIGSTAGFGTLGVLTGNVYLNGASVLEFASGQIATIASGARLNLYGASLLADASDTTHNSALAGLSDIAGAFDFAYGETLAISNNVSILSGGGWGIDGDGYTTEGGSHVTVAGTLSNSGNLTIGPSTGGLSSATSLTAEGLVNAGQVELTGNGTAVATAQINGDVANTDEIIINGGATLAATGTYAQQSGDTDVGGTLNAATATISGGTLRGGGTIDASVQDTGATMYGGGSPSSPGTLTISGSLAIGAGATLLESIGGTGAGQASEIVVHGPLDLQGGTLDIDLLNGVSLAAGDIFNVLSVTPGDLTGTFATLLFGSSADPGTGSSTIGNGLYITPIYDNADGLVRLAITGTPYNPPTITAPGPQLINAGSATAISGISVVVHQPGTVTVQVTDKSGLLAATASGTATVTGDDSTTLILSGDVADVNQELASLRDTPQGAGLSDNLSISATDSALQTGSATVTVAINQPPTLALPSFALEAPGTAEPLAGISVADLSSGETLTAVLIDTAGLLSATASGAGAVSGSDSTHLTLTGSLTELNAELANLTFDGNAGDTLSITVNDDHGLSASGTLAVEVSAPPTLTTPTGSVTEFNSAAASFSGVSLTAPTNAPADFQTTVTVQSGLGTLATTPTGGVMASGGGTKHLTLTGTIPALNAALATLTYSGPSSGTTDTVTISTPSGTGTPTTQNVPVNLTPPAPPVLTLPSAAADPGVLTPIDGLSVADATGESDSVPLTVVLSDTTGILRLQYLASGATVSGAGTTTMTLTGTAAEIDGDLAQLTFQASGTAAAAGALLDTIHVSASAGGATANGSVFVYVPPLGGVSDKPETPPAILDYTGALPPDETSTEGGQIRSDGDLITVYLGLPATSGTAVQYALGSQNNDTGPINVTYYVQSNPGAIGFTTTSDGGAPIEGQAAISLSYILTAIDQNPQPGDTITYVIKSTDDDGSVLPDDRVTVKFGKAPGGQSITPFPSTHTTNGNGPTPYIITPGGFSFPKSVIPHSQGGSLETHIRQISPTSSGGSSGKTGSDAGDVHLTTFDGLLYNFMGTGEFVLAKSTAPGDTFQVQIRTQPWSNGSSASVTTEIAAAVGTHRVTFDLDRTDTVWVDGTAVTLTPGGAPIDLGDGTLRELTATSWTIRWDSGEILNVTDNGTYLNAQITLTPNAQPGSVEGLLGSDSGNLANEFTLPDGTVLAQPLSYNDLYTTWADAWRVTQATSLLDYGVGQTTATFTDLSYPSDSEPTSLFPAALIAQAESLVAAAGITNPAAAQAAVEDYLLTGDTSFITTDAELGAAEKPSALATEPSSPNAAGGVGVAAVDPVVVEPASGTTAVAFSVYRIGDDSSSQVVDYQVETGAAGELGASDFAGDILPSGQVTIAAGSTITSFTIDITSQLGSTPSATLAVDINTGTGGTPVLAATAQVAVVNNQPVPGTPALPVFVNEGQVGTLTQVGNNFTLDLGSFDLDAIPPSIIVDLANGGSVGADLLGGIFGVSKPDGLGVSSGTGPVVNLGTDGLVPLSFQVDTATEGSFSQRIVFDANETNSSGYQASIGTYSLTVLASVAAPPSGSVMPDLINFGAVHEGSTVDQAVTISNSASGTVVVNGTAVGAATISSDSVTLAPDTTSAGSLDVGLDTSNDGVQTGVAILPLASQGDVGAVADLLLPPASVSGIGSFVNSASLLADGVVAPDGTADSAASAVSWTDTATTFTYNFGSIETVAAALLSVDATGTYVVSTSTDDVNFTPLFTITPESSTGSGLETRSNLPGSPFYDPAIAFAPTNAQYVRLQAVGGNGTYAASELDLFAATPTVAVTGTVFAEAVPTLSSSSPLYLHVGDLGMLTVTVANDAPTDGYGEDLIAAVTATPTGGFTLGSPDSTGDIAPGGSGTFTLDFSTAQTGVVSGDVQVALTSDGGSGAGSIDNLGQTALPGQTVQLTAEIDAYANPVFAVSGTIGTITGSGQDFTLNIGMVEHDTGPFSFGLSVVNDVAGPADLLSGSFTTSGGFATSGLGSFSGLTAGSADRAPELTLDTGSDGVFTQMVTLTPTDSNPSGFNEVLPAETIVVTGTVADLPLPTINVAPTLTAFIDEQMLVGPLTVGDPNSITQPITVSISDTTGTLAVVPAGSIVQQLGTNAIVLIGNLTDINDELASLTYTGDALGTDAISVDVTDQYRVQSTSTIAVTTAPVPLTQAILNGPTSAIAVLGSASAIGGLSLSDPGAVASGETITLTFSDPGVILTTHGDSGAVVTGQGTDFLSITGTVPQINEYLSDDLEYTDLIGLLADEGIIGKQTASILKVTTPEGLVTEVGGPTEAKFFEVGVENASFELLNVIGALPGNTPPDYNAHIQRLKEIIFGKPEIVLPDGSIYNLEAAGEFILSASTLSGDSFLVEARIQPVAGSDTTSEITQIAAQLGNDRVTFGVDRASVVWVDGTAVAMTQATPIDLSGGEVTQVSATQYQVTWNTGEVLDVFDDGGYLSVEIAPGPNDPDGSIAGLINNGASNTSDFTLPDGTTLAEPLSSADLQTYINAWRVPQAASLLDYAPGQTTATFTDTNFATTPLSLADLPASVVADAASAVAATGITDPGAVQAMELDYIASGGDPNVLSAAANLFTGITTAPVTINPTGPAPVVLGVVADAAIVQATGTSTTPVVFDAYLTGTSAADTVVTYAAIAAGAGFLDAASFGGTLPSGSVTIAAGQTLTQFTIDLPATALGSLPSDELEIQIGTTSGVSLINTTAQTTINQPVAGPPPVPVITDLVNIGTFYQIGNNYTLDLGAIQYGEPLPAFQFSIENAGSAGVDNLGGTFDVPTVAGFSVTGASLPQPLGAGQSYDGLDVSVNYIKFGANEETITYTPEDSNSTGFSAALQPITLTVLDDIVPPTMVYSYAWGDVHIITYNGLEYNFQAEGEFTLAQSRIPGDSFDIQLRLQPESPTASVTYITQVAVSVGSDRITFDTTRPDFVQIDGAATTINMSDPVVHLADGTLTEISTSVFRVDWNTGEEMTVTDYGTYMDVADGIPLSEPESVGGLQGEDAGQANDFQLSDGTILQQPLTTSELYGPYANSWRVSQASSLFDYLPGQSTATFTNTNFPRDVVSLSSLPASVVAQAASIVAAAGITDPNIAAAAELDYLATGDMSFVDAAADVAAQQPGTAPAPITNDMTVVPAVGIEAPAQGVVEQASTSTPVVFDAYLTSPASTDTTVTYAVVDGGAGYFGAAAFGGVLPSGTVTIDAGQTLVAFTIDVPQAALGIDPSAKLEVAVASPGGDPLFAPEATAIIVNDTPEPGAPPIPLLAELTNFGTLIQIGNDYTLDLGNLTQGETVPVIQLALFNDATAPADSLSGTFSVPTGSGFIVTGNALNAAIAAGMDYSGLDVGAITSSFGSNSETLTFFPRDVNESGYMGSLAPITLTIEDSIAAPADAALNTPSSIIFANVRVGGTDSRALSITNSAVAPAANLDVTAAAFGDATVSGAVTGLAPGQTDVTDITAGLNTGTAGMVAGIVALTPASDNGAGGTVALAGSLQVDEFGSVYRPAAPTVGSVDQIVHVGSPGTVALDIANTASADGFSENLLATLGSVTSDTGTLSIAAAGPTGEIAAGSSDTSSLVLGFSTANAGTVAGTATVDLTSDGGTGTASIDGLGTMGLAPQTAAVDITVNNYANPVFEDVSHLGTLTNAGTAYALDLGTVLQDSGSFVVDLGVLNDVVGPADLASSSLQASASSAFTLSGLAAFSDLATGQADIAPMVTLSTDGAGIFAETITLAATGSNSSGYAAALPGETLTVTGTVAASSFVPAIADVLTASPIDFGAVHLEATGQQALDIENAASAGAASLDASVLSVNGDATASGSFNDLAPGATDSTDIVAGINTGTAGNKSGDVALAFVADDGTGGSGNLPGQDIVVTGSVYREALAALLPVSEIVHVGDPGTAAITVANDDPADGYSVSLIASLAATSGDIGIASGGPTGDIVAGGTNSGSLVVDFSTAQAGTISGDGTVALTSDGGVGAGSIDGLGQTALLSQVVPVDITVDNYANAELTSNGNLTANGIGGNAFTLDLGTATVGAAALSANLGVLNDVAGPADWLNGTFAVSGDSQFANTGFAAFSTIGAGESLDVGSIALQTGQTGVLSESIVLTPTDTNADGFSKIQTAQTVTVVGTIVASGSIGSTGTTSTTGTAQGDVHMVTYDGLHYDFQADGAYVLTRSTVPGDSFQIQIQTAAERSNGAVSLTTVAAAQVGSDVVTFAIQRDDTVWLNGAPDTALSAADSVQTLDGGVLAELSPTSFQLTWSTGETLVIENEGKYLNSAVGLGPGDGPGSMQGLLGADSGQANDFQLPDGGILPQPLSSSELLGAFANAWTVTPADSLLGASATDGGADAGIVPAAIGAAAADTTQFIYADGTGAQTVLQATAAGQTLSAGAGVGTLSDASGFGVTFQGILAQLAQEQISGFSAKDLIDITDLAAATVSTSYAGTASAGVLSLTDGTQTGQLHLSGQLGLGNFHATSDGHGGTDIALA